MKSRSVYILVLVVVASFLFAIAGLCGAEPPLPQELTPQERATLLEQIKPYYEKAQTGCRWWTIAYHGCLFLSAAASAAAAVVLKLDRFKDNPAKSDIAAALAALAALLTLLNTSGNFNQKWIANRTTRTALDQLKLDILLPPDASNPQLSEATKRFKDILGSHDRMIVGESPDRAPGPTKPK